MCHYFCSACHNCGSDAEQSLCKRKTKYQGFHVPKLCYHVAAHKDTVDMTTAKKTHDHLIRLSPIAGSGMAVREVSRSTSFSTECSKTDYLQPITMCALQGVYDLQM